MLRYLLNVCTLHMINDGFYMQNNKYKVQLVQVMFSICQVVVFHYTLDNGYPVWPASDGTDQTVRLESSLTICSVS